MPNVLSRPLLFLFLPSLTLAISYLLSFTSRSLRVCGRREGERSSRGTGRCPLPAAGGRGVETLLGGGGSGTRGPGRRRGAEGDAVSNIYVSRTSSG